MNKKYFNYINTAFITLPMTLIMSFTGIVLNYGFKESWLKTLMATSVIMFPVAYFSVLIIVPIAKKLTNKLMGQQY